MGFSPAHNCKFHYRLPTWADMCTGLNPQSEGAHVFCNQIVLLLILLYKHLFFGSNCTQMAHLKYFVWSILYFIIYFCIISPSPFVSTSFALQYYRKRIHFSLSLIFILFFFCKKILNGLNTPNQCMDFSSCLSANCGSFYKSRWTVTIHNIHRC